MGFIGFVALSTILFYTPQMAAAATTNFVASLDGSQEVPPNIVPGNGTGSFQYDDATKMLSFNIEFSGLSGPETGAHIHGPALPGVDGSLIFPLPSGSPKVGSVGPLTPSQEVELFDGLLYVNVHSLSFPGGEIRGQILMPNYDLNIFEGTNPSDLIIDLGQEAKAVANTTDPLVSQANFTWNNPSGDPVHTELVSLSLTGQAEDTFKPDEVGKWTVFADFGNGVVKQQTFDVRLLVIPESPIGLIALVVSSFAALGAYMKFKTKV